MRNVWILVRRYEWEDQSNETEYCDVFPFWSRADAISKAKSLLKADMKKHASLGTESYAEEANALAKDLASKYFPKHLTELTDGDDVVFELYRKPVRGSRAVMRPNCGITFGE